MKAIRARLDNNIVETDSDEEEDVDEDEDKNKEDGEESWRQEGRGVKSATLGEHNPSVCEVCKCGCVIL